MNSLIIVNSLEDEKFGIYLHDKIELLLNHMKRILKQNKSQFYIIRGPLGVGKSLFIRKTLNNFIGLNDNLGQKYFKTDYQF